jgi:hypothetical protein
VHEGKIIMQATGAARTDSVAFKQVMVQFLSGNLTYQDLLRQNY